MKILISYNNTVTFISIHIEHPVCYLTVLTIHITYVLHKFDSHVLVTHILGFSFFIHTSDLRNEHTQKLMSSGKREHVICPFDKCRIPIANSPFWQRPFPRLQFYVPTYTYYMTARKSIRKISYRI